MKESEKQLLILLFVNDFWRFVLFMKVCWKSWKWRIKLFFKNWHYVTLNFVYKLVSDFVGTKFWWQNELSSSWIMQFEKDFKVGCSILANHSLHAASFLHMKNTSWKWRIKLFLKNWHYVTLNFVYKLVSDFVGIKFWWQNELSSSWIMQFEKDLFDSC